jgi:hypothetical protein
LYNFTFVPISNYFLLVTQYTQNLFYLALLSVQDDDDVRQPLCSDKLYDGCGVNILQAVLLIFSYATRHSLSRVAIEDLLQLIHAVLPTPNALPRSYYYFEKHLPAVKSSVFITNHYFIVSDTDTIVAVKPSDIAHKVVFLGGLHRYHNTYLLALQPNTCECD